MRIAVIGAGKMGSALLGGWIRTGRPVADFVATTGSEERAGFLRDLYPGLHVIARGNIEAVRQADVIVLGVKPFTVPKVMDEIANELRDGQIVISLAAALPISVIEKRASRPMTVFRAMPNIPVVVEEGAIALCCNDNYTENSWDGNGGIVSANVCVENSTWEYNYFSNLGVDDQVLTPAFEFYGKGRKFSSGPTTKSYIRYNTIEHTPTRALDLNNAQYLEVTGNTIFNASRGPKEKGAIILQNLTGWRATTDIKIDGNTIYSSPNTLYGIGIGACVNGPCAAFTELMIGPNSINVNPPLCRVPLDPQLPLPAVLFQPGSQTLPTNVPCPGPR